MSDETWTAGRLRRFLESFRDDATIAIRCGAPQAEPIRHIEHHLSPDFDLILTNEPKQPERKEGK